MKTFIIAEAGVNHNGSLDVARKMVDAAREAGADAVKFQTFRAEELAAPSAHKADYQTAATGKSESQLEMLRRLELPEDSFRELCRYCETRGITFLSTAFGLGTLEFLMQLSPMLLKVPSGEITNLPYLRAIARCGRPVIVSTGMCSLAEVEDALHVLISGGVPRDELTVLHCTTEYPAPFTEVNLRAMLTLRDAFGVKVGYSDHTLGIEVAVAAVALGAVVIEKHFTLDRNLPGPDHKASLEPMELKAMVTAIRNVEASLGSPVKEPGSSERRNISVARKSIVAGKLIRQGEVFTPDNLQTKRPGTGISPMRWDEVIGRRAIRDFAPDDKIEI